MAEKRTKADKAQRQADRLEKKARHPAPKKKPTRTTDQVAARIARGTVER